MTSQFIIRDGHALRREGLIQSLSQFRARVLHADGRRPQFRTVAGRYADLEECDDVAAHALVFEAGALVGCVRVAPFARPFQSATRTLVGAARWSRVLRRYRVDAHACTEVSRWIVAPEARRPRLALGLVAASFAISEVFGCRRMFAMCGVRDRQAEGLERAGGEPVAGIAPMFVPEFDDWLRLLSFPVPSPNALVRRALRPLEGEVLRFRREVGASGLG